MGMTCELTKAFHFTYRSEFSNGLIENEFDHVFFGTTDEQPNPNPDEVSAWKYIAEDELTTDIAANPGSYTEWLKIAFEKTSAKYAKQKS
jgi:isopentenyl-diphosphate delta-isomerase